MYPAQLLARIKQGNLLPAVLLLGPESYQRRKIKQAVKDAYAEDAFAEHDLTELSLAEVVDDARALSLFAAERVIWVINAEAALPRGRSEEENEGGEGSAGDTASLSAYLKDPTPGVSVVFEASRFDFEGDDKRRQERVRKFFTGIPEVVELRRFAAHEALAESEKLVRQYGLRMEAGALDLLVEALGADVARIALELEKLVLYANGRSIGVDEISALVPDARTATIFALVNALARRDRTRSLEVLDTLVKEGEYLPLVLTFLSTQFRMALVARDAGLKSAGQVQSYFTRMGVPMWGARADQVYQTVSRFTPKQLEVAVKLIFEADRGLRDARPDDRTVVEQFVLAMTG
ncbi:MAG: DNA polymerase III subunit delta [Acidobacteriia bacterium]|nr:DNA polymerase III subunit delta [Terriglobia bacterium]